jgi:hypothetical protein
MSLGWIVVLIMGFVPLLLIYLTSGNNEENNQQRRGEQRNEATQKNQSNKKRNFVYSTWRVVLVVNVFMDEQLATIKPQFASLLSRLAQECELYIVGQVKSDREEENITKAITSANISTNADKTITLVDAGLNVNKILYCETDRGKIAIARQLEPDIYVDVEDGVVTELARFLPLVALIKSSATNTSKIQQKVISPSLTELFDAIQNRKI